ncbi:protein of unknown function [Taphrina deformans PYCC 5710]|uniref:Uncharacterized protein n=1 Tax=Taphrina deformans (strain PYCC 5710 / ATCC 11124 / CBS 356.35 / IMI 108563 / JCM 9778 / NBRC 8474) TaxID=1097556 RepID=R5A803_TAPDE|nr:protein of unknown function [Taphrina deformans PYCC 5710]|eukprot:CCX35419.1 protein of unknown function [Taphrina deformans PYCC 5710]
MTQKSATLLATAITRPTSPDCVSLRPRLHSEIELPLERYRPRPLKSCQIPSSLSEAVTGWTVEHEDTENTLFQDAILNLFNGLQLYSQSCVYEGLASDDSFEQFLTTFRNGPEALDEVCHTLTLTEEYWQSAYDEALYIELPLLPLTHNEPSITVNVDLSNCDVGDTLAAEAKETQGLTLESFDSSSSYLPQLVSTISLPDTPAKLRPYFKLDIDSPLSPRRMTPNSLLTDNTIGRKFLFQDCQPWPQSTSPPESSLEELFDLSASEIGTHPLSKEKLVDHCFALRVEEPDVPKVTQKPNLKEYPTCMLDLQRARTKDRDYHVVNAVPARHLDFDLRWNPFSKPVPPFSFEEDLNGDQLIDDFVHELPESPTLHSTSDVLVRGTHVENLTSPLVSNTSGAYRIIDTQHGINNSNREVERKPLDAQARLLFRTRKLHPSPASAVLSESRLSDDGVLEQLSRSSQTIQESTCEEARVRVNPHEVVPRSGHTNPPRSATYLSTISSETPSTSYWSAKPEDAYTEPLQKRRRTAKASSDHSQHYRPIKIRDKIDMHIRMQGKEVICREPRSSDRVIPAPEPEPVLVEPKERSTIAPANESEGPSGIHWIVSISLLQLSSISRVFSRQNELATLIERDLPQSIEADVVVSASTSIVLFRLEHVLGASRDTILPAQHRIMNLLWKYDNLIILVLSRTPLSESQVIDLVSFQSWVLGHSRNSRCIICTSEYELTQYLIYNARKWGSQQIESVQEDETLSELVLRDCPFINAMVSQLILNRTTLYAFLCLSYQRKLEVLSRVGVSDDRGGLIARFFSTDWHADPSEEPVVGSESDYVDAKSGEVVL